MVFIAFYFGTIKMLDVNTVVFIYKKYHGINTTVFSDRYHAYNA